MHQIGREKRTVLGSLSKGVFERRTATANETFSLFTRLGATIFVILSVFTLIEKIYLKIRAHPLLKNEKRLLPVAVRRSKTPLLKLPSEANRDGADAESPFPLFFSFSALFKNSSPREKVAKLPPFWDWWTESLFVSIIVAKYNIFANNGRSRKKTKILAKRFAHAISVHYRDFEHAYVY